MSSANYIVVGGCLSGLVVASRLTEDPKVTVTVLEAGGETFHTENIDVPANIVANWTNPTSMRITDRCIAVKVLEDRLCWLLGNSQAGSTEYDAFEKLGN
ncbi:hypothetical protein D9758_006628 [Tetrapyrgos nigripes]|uniref:Glucose-methanol-choline oxidoreductase N-terminal domain-containing protein n=1 Tax=Tetrapyrgos nigripes TaxID=182062 RepID=A0A8H5GJT5_9AGAR|nr:hypothetical protein D9758_006628 [Tetrapyrgos nigripes]